MHSKTEVNTLLVGKASSSDIAGKAEKLTTYTMTETNTLISNSFKLGVLRLYDDDATERGIILHPTAIHFAVRETFNPTGSSVITALTLDQGAFILCNIKC